MTDLVGNDEGPASMTATVRAMALALLADFEGLVRREHAGPPGDLARASRDLAEAAARLPGTGPPVLQPGGIVAAVLSADEPLADQVAAAVLGPVLRLSAGERALLLDTLQAWIDADGSPGRAAEALFCHRNTVLNRMRRLETLTGRAVERPNDLVELSLALTQLRRSR